MCYGREIDFPERILTLFSFLERKKGERGERKGGFFKFVCVIGVLKVLKRKDQELKGGKRGGYNNIYNFIR